MTWASALTPEQRATIEQQAATGVPEEMLRASCEMLGWLP